MLKSTEEISELVFTPKTRNIIFGNLKKGLKCYYSFIEENKKFFDRSNIANFFPAARAYAIERQFAIEAEKATSPFTFFNKELGLFKFKVGFINLDGVIVSIAKTYKKDSLPSRSKYKIELSKANVFEQEVKQLSLFDIENIANSDDLLSENTLNKPKYCIVTYGIMSDTLSHAKIIMPKSDYKGYQLNLDLMKSIELVEIEQNEEDEENIATIKSELENHYVRKGEGNE